MRRRHFEALRPVCPVCRGGHGQPGGSHGQPGGSPTPLSIATIERGEGDHILEGALHCSNPACRREYPIVDGIPIIIPSLREYLRENLLAVYGRSDLSEASESVLGDCCGAGSEFETMRQHASSYAWDHYADLDPAEADVAADSADGTPRPGACVRMLEAGLELVGEAPGGPIVDLGCATGRVAIELAARTGEMVLGVDLYYPTLRIASEVVRRGRLRYPRRRTGVVYDRREFAVDLPGRDNVDMWACDVAALPFTPGTFATCVGFNLLDSVRSPLDLLGAVAEILAPDGIAMLASPYDWSPAVTAMEAWIGGHSQRGGDRGNCDAIVRKLLTPGAHPGTIGGLELRGEKSAVPWQVRMHERSTATYQCHLVVARRT